jgi:phospholipid/cholesterol/gamma-HCH transport system substrate-binding protein
VDLAYAHKAAINQALTDISRLSVTFGGRGDELVRLAGDLDTVAPALSGNPQKVTQLLDALDHFSTGLNSDLITYGDRLGPLVDATGHTVNVFYLQRNNIVPLLMSLNAFFGSLNSVIRVQGPQGSMLAQVYNYLPLDLCQTLVDVCGPYAGKGAK